MNEIETAAAVNCPACGHQMEAPAEKCPRCGEHFDDAGANARRAEDWRVFIERLNLALLLIGLAVLCGCWIYDKGQGMIGGGFLAVVGAILLRRK
jgi:DNA-directed RNA polymerase subunit RPC12/RpoP